METQAVHDTGALAQAAHVAMTWLLRRDKQGRGQPLGMDAEAARERLWLGEQLPRIELAIARNPEAGQARIHLQVREGKGRGCSVRGLVLLRSLLAGTGGSGEATQWRSFFRVQRSDFEAVAEALRELCGTAGGVRILGDALLGTAMGRLDYAILEQPVENAAPGSLQHDDARCWRSGLLLELGDLRSQVPAYSRGRVLEAVCADDIATSGRAIGAQGEAFLRLAMHEVLAGMAHGMAQPGVMAVAQARLRQDVPEAWAALELAPVDSWLDEMGQAIGRAVGGNETLERIALSAMRGVCVTCAYLHAAKGVAPAEAPQANFSALLLDALGRSSGVAACLPGGTVAQTAWLELCARSLDELGNFEDGLRLAPQSDFLQAVCICRAVLACGAGAAEHGRPVSARARQSFARHLSPSRPGVMEAMAMAWLGEMGNGKVNAAGPVEPWLALDWLGAGWTQRDWLDTASRMVARVTGTSEYDRALQALQDFQARALAGKDAANPARRRRA